MRGVEYINDTMAADMPFITYNGAVVVMGKSKKRLLERKLAPELCREAVSLGLETDAGVFAWVNDELYTFGEREHNDIYRRIAKFEPTLVTDMDSILQNGADKALWSGPAEVIGALQTQMRAHFGARLNCHTSSPMLLEFVDPDASKAKAMEILGEHYGIERGEMAAIGDGYNDVSMLEYAGLGIAMANAPDEVKNMADRVTLSNDEDGVANAIYKFILGEGN